VLAVLKQVTDFRYFAAKMHAYNVVLDREAASAFAPHRQGSATFFVSDEVLRDQEVAAPPAKKTSSSTQCEHFVARPNLVATEVKKPEVTPVQAAPELQSACTQTDDIELIPEPVEPEEEEPPAPVVPVVEAPAPVAPVVEAPPRPVLKLAPVRQLSSTQVIEIAPEVKVQVPPPAKPEPARPALAQTAKPVEPKKRPPSRENIDLNLTKHERAKPVAPEDPMLALRRALAGRVKNIIDDS
jgi:hypothetical protein